VEVRDPAFKVCTRLELIKNEDIRKLLGMQPVKTNYKNMYKIRQHDVRDSAV
jgi:hypothetical protein